MEMKMGIEIYKTSDIALAAFLYCKGVHLSTIDREDPQRAVFVFDSPDPNLLTQWQQGQAFVNALAFHSAYQELKARLFRRVPR